MNDLVDPIAGGVAGRLRLLVLALDRLDRLESGTGMWREGFAAAELNQSSTQLTLRLLHTISNPANFALLQLLASTDAHSLSALMAATGMGRLVLSERLNDLVQVGLATRLIDTDQAQIAAAGVALVQWVEEIAAASASQFITP